MQSILRTLLEITAYSAVIFAGILLLKGLWGKKMSPILHYALWFVLLARLAIPVTLDSGFSLFTLQANGTSIPAAANAALWDTAAAGPQDPAGNVAVAPEEAAPPQPAYAAPQETQRAAIPLAWMRLAMGIWLAGIAGCFVWLGLLYATLLRRIGKNAAMPSKKLLTLLEEVKGELGIRSSIRLLCLYEYGTPALLFPRTILMPVDALTVMNPEQVKLALRHELTHFKRGDQVMNVLLSLINAIYWFDPIVWIAFKRMRADMETACDCMVTRSLNSREKNAYANLILTLFSQPAHRQVALGMAEASTRKVAEQRIRGIFMPRSTRPVVRVISIVAVLILMVGCFTTACIKNPAEGGPATVTGGGDGPVEVFAPDAAAAATTDYGVSTAIDGDTITAITARGETYRFLVNELPLPEHSLPKPGGCISAVEAAQKAVPLVVTVFPEVESPCAIGAQFSYFDEGDGYASQCYELYFGGTDYDTAQYYTGLSTLEGDDGGVLSVRALFPGEPAAVTSARGMRFDWDGNYKDAYAVRALELARALIQDKIAPGGEIGEDSFIDGIQVAFGFPDLFALDAKIHMQDGASYTVQYLMPSERISSFLAYPLGWHSAIWGYTDPAEEKAYPSLDGSYTWDDASAYTEAQSAPSADIIVTEEMYEAIAETAEDMIGRTFEPDLSNVIGEENLRTGYIMSFSSMVRKRGYGLEPLAMSSSCHPIESMVDGTLRRGREIIIARQDNGEIVCAGIWLGEGSYAYANYDTRRIERNMLTAADYTENLCVKVEAETTLRVPIDDSPSPASTPAQGSS